MTFRLLSSAALLTLLPLGMVRAGGFQTLPASAPALGLAGAVTATSRDASAAWFNPGAMGLLDSASASIGLTTLRVGRIFRSAVTDQTTTADASVVFSPYAYVATPLDSAHHWVVGLSVNSPFGYDTKWPADWSGSSLVREARIRTLFVQPTWAYRVSDRFSIGAGPVLVEADYKQEHALGEFAQATGRYDASGQGLGLNVGLEGRAGDKVAFGIAYRTSVTVRMGNGAATFTGIPSSQAYRFPAAANFSTTIRLPSQLSAGISNRVNAKLLVNFTFDLTGWSVYDSLKVDFSNQTKAAEHTGRRYQDAMTFRIGAEYQLTPAFMLRGGIYYDESPVRDQNVTPDLPDANMLGGAVGIGYRMGRHLSLDAAYTYGRSASRNTTATATNAAIAGAFRNNQHGGALNLSYQF